MCGVSLSRVWPYIRGVKTRSTLVILAENIRRLRLGRELTQQSIAEKGKFSYKHYQAIETARLKGLTFSTIERLSNLLNVEVWKLFHPTVIAKPKIKKIARKKISR